MGMENIQNVNLPIIVCSSVDVIRFHQRIEEMLGTGKYEGNFVILIGEQNHIDLKFSVPIMRLDQVENVQKKFFVVVCGSGVYGGLYTYLKIKKKMIDLNLIEFSNFTYYTLYKKKICYINGNCHGPVVEKYLNGNNSFKQEYGIYPVVPVYASLSNTPIDDNILRHIDLLIYQRIRLDNKYGSVTYGDEYILPRLKKNALAICMPNLWPLGDCIFQSQTMHIYNDENNRPGFYQDILLEQAYEEMGGENIEKIYDRYNCISIKSDDVHNKFEEQLSRILNREKRWDISISDYMRNNYCHIPMFHDIGHPSSYLILYICKQILKLLKLKEEENEAKTYDESYLKNFDLGLYGLIPENLQKILNIDYNAYPIKKRLNNLSYVKSASGNPIRLTEGISDTSFIQDYFFISKKIILPPK